MKQQILLFISCLAQSIKKSQIQALEFHSGLLSKSKRYYPRPQLTCVSGDGCAYPKLVPDTVYCRNLGWDGEDYVWQCAGISSQAKFGKIKVNCEGYRYDSDPRVLIGSCALDYELFTTPDFHKSITDQVIDFIIDSNTIFAKRYEQIEELKLESIEPPKQLISQNPIDLYDDLIQVWKNFNSLMNSVAVVIIHTVTDVFEFYVDLVENVFAMIYDLFTMLGSTFIVFVTAYYISITAIAGFEFMQRLYQNEGLIGNVKCEYESATSDNEKPMPACSNQGIDNDDEVTVKSMQEESEKSIERDDEATVSSNPPLEPAYDATREVSNESLLIKAFMNDLNHEDVKVGYEADNDQAETLDSISLHSQDSDFFFVDNC